MTRSFVIILSVSAALVGGGASRVAAQSAVDAQLPASAAEALGAQIRAIVAEPAVSRDHWGVMVSTVDGTPVASVNEAQLFQPASNAKLYTTAAAMALLGPEKTFETRLIGEGEWTGNSTLDGNLVIVGNGDANLSGRAIPYVAPELRPKDQAPANPLRYLEEMADAVAATGLKTVNGDIVGDDSGSEWNGSGDGFNVPWADRYPSDWALDDLVWGFGAPVTSLVINDNQIKLTVVPGARTEFRTKGSAAPRYADATVKLEPALDYYRVYGSVTTTPGKGSNSVYITREPGVRDLYVTGTVFADAPPDVEEIAIEDPGEFAAIALKGMLERRGVAVAGKASSRHGSWIATKGFLAESHEAVASLDTARVGKGSAGVIGCVDCGPQKPVEKRVLASHTSPMLGEDVVVTNKVSQNLHAELLQRHLGERLGDTGSAAQGARVVRAFLTARVGIDKEDFVFYDGSGLSGHDLVTPRATAKLLAYAAAQPWFAQWKASLPVGGVDGSLEGRFPRPPLKGHVFAKTGTLGEARALSGYVDCASGRTVIFSIMVGNHPPGSTADRDVMDRIVAAIAAAL